MLLDGFWHGSASVWSNEAEAYTTAGPYCVRLASIETFGGYGLDPDHYTVVHLHSGLGMKLRCHPDELATAILDAQETAP